MDNIFRTNIGYVKTKYDMPLNKTILIYFQEPCIFETSLL